MTSTAPLHGSKSSSPADAGLDRLVPTRRLTDLPTYVFAWLDELKAEARARGADLIDLGMGNPDQPTPQPIIDTIMAAYADPKNHGYPPFDGTPAFRNAVAGYMQDRFGVTVDPNTEVLCLSGATRSRSSLTSITPFMAARADWSADARTSCRCAPSAASFRICARSRRKSSTMHES